MLGWQQQGQDEADIFMVRCYDSPEDERRNPLGMRPLLWRGTGGQHSIRYGG
jgi:hypothetical protein